MSLLRRSESDEIVRSAAPALRIHRGLAVLLSAILVGTLCGPSSLTAADEPPGRIRRAYVPADKPEVWPAGRWEALPINDFRQLLKDLSEDEALPPQALLRRVSYTATWSEDSSIEGQLTAEVGLRGFTAKNLSLGKPTLALSDLSWQDRPAVWGTDPEGRSLLRIESDGSQLQGHWSLRGREVLGDVEFNAVLLPAFISRLELRLPSPKHVHVGEGLLAVALADPIPGWRRWVVDLGNRSQLQFVVSDEPQLSASPQLLTRRTSQYRLLPDGLQFRTNFTINNLGGAVQELLFDVPPEMPISSVMLGSDAELPFQRVNDAELVRVDVPLSSIAQNSQVSVTVQGLMPFPSEKSWVLPRISLTQSHLIESGMSIKVHRPLELSDYSAKDCRLISSTMNRNQTDSLELEDWSDTSELTVTLETPQADVVSDVLAVVSGDVSQSTMRTLLMLSTRSGSVYRLPCLVPPGWKVTRATSIPWTRPNIVAQWSTTSTDEDGSQLMIEFRDALTPEQSVIIEVSARHVSDPRASAMAMPVLRPADALPRSIAMIFAQDSGLRLSLPTGSPYVEQTLAAATAEWTNVLEDTQWIADAVGSTTPERVPFVISTKAPTGTDRLVITPAVERTPPLTAETGTTTPNPAADLPASEGSARSDREATPISKRLVADVTVETSVPEAPDQPCVQVVHYALPASAAGTNLRFQLSSPASLIAARGDDTSTTTLISDQEVEIQLPGAGDHFQIELEYRTPISQSLLSGTAMIPLPQSEVITSDLCWRLLLPESFRLVSSTTGSSFEQPRLNWTQRLIGPLGRSTRRDASALVPAVDQQEVTSAHLRATDTKSMIAQRSRLPSEGFREHTRSVPFTADVLRLEVWNEDVAFRLGWLLTVAGCLMIGVIRRFYPVHGPLLISLFAMTAGFLSAIVPDPLAIPCGGLCFGVLCGVLLPRRLWKHEMPLEKRPVGSTRRAPVLAGAAMSILIVMVWFTSLASALQDSESAPPTASQPMENSSQQESQWDALIPVMSQRPTLDETAVAYVTPALFERWELLRRSKSQSPDYLLREAEYVITFDQRPFPRMAAVFDVVLLNPLTRQIHLPLDGIAVEGEDACTVNGQVATIIPLRTSQGVSIDLASVKPTPLPAGESRNSLAVSTPDTAEERAKVLRVAIDCRLRSPRTPNRQHVDLFIPPLLSTTALLKHGGLSAENLEVDRFGSRIQDHADQSTTVELGPVRRLLLDWPQDKADPRSGRYPPEVAMTRIVVHPQHLQAKSRLRFLTNGSSGVGLDSSLEFNLPTQTQVQDVRAPGLVSWKVRHRDPEPVTVRLTFSEPPPSASFVVEIESVLPGALSADKLTIPEFSFLTGSPAADFPVHSVGLSAAPGFRVEHLPALYQSNQVLRLPVDQFEQEWADEELFNLDLAFSLKASQPLGVRVTPVLTERRADIRESLIIDRSAVQWQADVELTLQGAPAVLHRLEIDPLIEVTNASVIQDGAEILTRWTRASDRQLMLLLANEVTGNQTIHLSGQVSLRPGDLMNLPEFTVANAAIGQQSLTLKTHPDWSVAVFDGQTQQLPLPEAEAASTSEPVAMHQHTFDQRSDASPRSIRIDEAISTFSFERLVTVETKEEEQWSLTTELLLPEEPLPHQVQVVVPRELASTGGLPKTTPPAQQSTLADGRLALIFGTTAPDFDSRRINIAWAITPNHSPSWQLPQVEVLNGLPKNEWLVLKGNSLYELEEQEQPPIEIDKLPEEWTLPSETDDSGIKVFHSADGNWTLTPSNLTDSDGFVRRLDTVIWEANAHEFCGVTTAQVSVRGLTHLTIPLPPGLRMTHVTWDGGIVSPLQDDGSAREFVLPVASDSMVQDTSYRMKLWWTLPRSSLAMRYHLPLLGPAGIPVTTRNVAFFGSEGSRYGVTGTSLVLETDSSHDAAVRSLSSGSPITRPLESAGYSALADPETNHVNSILVGTFDDVESPPSAAAVISLWRLSCQLRRTLLVLLISLLGMIVGWKTQLYGLIRSQASTLTRSPFAGPTCLAAVLWASGPAWLGFGLTLVCGIAWGVAIWRTSDHATGFEYTATTTT